LAPPPFPRLLGGGDTLANVWPQCGPDAVTLNRRNFKQKDMVENYLADQVKQGTIALGERSAGSRPTGRNTRAGPSLVRGRR